MCEFQTESEIVAKRRQEKPSIYLHEHKAIKLILQHTFRPRFGHVCCIGVLLLISGSCILKPSGSVSYINIGYRLSFSVFSHTTQRPNNVHANSCHIECCVSIFTCLLRLLAVAWMLSVLILSCAINVIILAIQIKQAAGSLCIDMRPSIEDDTQFAKFATVIRLSRLDWRKVYCSSTIPFLSDAIAKLMHNEGIYFRHK